MIDKIVLDYKTEAKDKGVELIWEKPAKPLPKVAGEEKYLSQAVTNLIDNAIKYTPAERKDKETGAQIKGRVEVKAVLDKNRIVIDVKDSGIGIPEDDLPKLFHKFVRAKNAVDIYTDGTGLGLFIVKEIVEGHNGKVGVTSIEGQGSTFTIYLPT